MNKITHMRICTASQLIEYQFKTSRGIWKMSMVNFQLKYTVQFEMSCYKRISQLVLLVNDFDEGCDIFFDFSQNNRLNNSRVVGKSRRHDVHFT